MGRIETHGRRETFFKSLAAAHAKDDDAAAAAAVDRYLAPLPAKDINRKLTTALSLLDRGKPELGVFARRHVALRPTHTPCTASLATAGELERLKRAGATLTEIKFDGFWDMQVAWPDEAGQDAPADAWTIFHLNRSVIARHAAMLCDLFNLSFAGELDAEGYDQGFRQWVMHGVPFGAAKFRLFVEAIEAGRTRFDAQQAQDLEACMAYVGARGLPQLVGLIKNCAVAEVRKKNAVTVFQDAVWRQSPTFQDAAVPTLARQQALRAEAARRLDAAAARALAVHPAFSFDSEDAVIDWILEWGRAQSTEPAAQAKALDESGIWDAVRWLDIADITFWDKLVKPDLLPPTRVRQVALARRGHKDNQGVGGIFRLPKRSPAVTQDSVRVVENGSAVTARLHITNFAERLVKGSVRVPFTALRARWEYLFASNGVYLYLLDMHPLTIRYTAAVGLCKATAQLHTFTTTDNNWGWLWHNYPVKKEQLLIKKSRHLNSQGALNLTLTLRV